MDGLSVAADKNITILEPGLRSRTSFGYRRYQNAGCIWNANAPKNDTVDQDCREQVHEGTGKQHCQPLPWTGGCQTARNVRVILAFGTHKSAERQPVEGETGARMYFGHDIHQLPLTPCLTGCYDLAGGHLARVIHGDGITFWVLRFEDLKRAHHQAVIDAIHSDLYLIIDQLIPMDG